MDVSSVVIELSWDDVDWLCLDNVLRPCESGSPRARLPPTLGVTGDGERLLERFPSCDLRFPDEDSSLSIDIATGEMGGKGFCMDISSWDCGLDVLLEGGLLLLVLL